MNDEIDDVKDEIPEPTPEQLAAQEEARKYGWKPQDEFDYDPKNWVDADRFLELPSTQNKMLRDELRDSEQARAAADNDFKERLDRIERTNKAVMEAAIQRQKDEHEAKVAEILAEQRKAAEDGDMASYDRLESQRQNLAPPASPEPSEAPQVDPAIAAYREANEWAKDPFMWNAAVQATAKPENVNKPVTELLSIAEAAAKEYFPHKFEQPKPKVSRVDGGGLAGGNKGKGAASLPPEAEKAAREFVEMGIFKSVDDYATEYFKES